MARLALSLSAGSTTIGNENFGPCHGEVDPMPAVAAATYATDKAAFETALAQLVTDAASPTQAHVTTANNAYTTFKADLGGASATQDLVVSFDKAKISSISSLRAALNLVLKAAEAAGLAK